MVYIFRHAERARGPNPSLTSMGFSQAQHLADAVQNGILQTPQKLWVSPQLRAQQTFQKLSEFTKIPLSIQKDLDEGVGDLNYKNLVDRVERVIRDLSQLSSQQNVFVCSHMDWLQEFTNRVPADRDLSPYSHWPACQYLAFEIVDHTWHFKKQGIINP